MRKLVLHLLIACSTCGVSVYLTNIWDSLGRADMPAQAFERSVSQSDWPGSTAEPGLREIYRDYASAQTNHDLAFFERVEADDFILFTSTGKTLSRSEDIQWLNSLPTGIVHTQDDLKMEIHAQAAIVTGRITATYSGGYSDSWRWIDVCLKRGGRWQIQNTTQVD